MLRGQAMRASRELDAGHLDHRPTTGGRPRAGPWRRGQAGRGATVGVRHMRGPLTPLHSARKLVHMFPARPVPTNPRTAGSVDVLSTRRRLCRMCR